MKEKRRGGQEGELTRKKRVSNGVSELRHNNSNITIYSLIIVSKSVAK